MSNNYTKEVLYFLSSEISGAEREISLKNIYLKYYNNPYNFIMHIQSLQNILKDMCKLAQNKLKYEEILEELIDAINSTDLGLSKYKGLSVQEIQYAFIVLKIVTL